jgi:FkbM family methyltransferase
MREQTRRASVKASHHRGRLAKLSSQLRTALLILTKRELPLAARVSFLAHGIGLISRRSAGYQLQLRGGAISLTEESDRGTLREVLHDYPADYRDAIVIDGGAHKGYFGAYALLKGARKVISYEPENGNYGALENVATQFRRNGYSWETVRAGIGAAHRDDTLYLSSSWGHTREPGLASTGAPTQDIRIVPMAEVIGHAASFQDGNALIVKLDVEGSEREILRETPTEAWAPVDEAFVEFHWKMEEELPEGERFFRSEIEGALGGAGLDLVATRHGVMQFRRTR